MPRFTKAQLDQIAKAAEINLTFARDGIEEMTVAYAWSASEAEGAFYREALEGHRQDWKINAQILEKLGLDPGEEPCS